MDNQNQEIPQVTSNYQWLRTLGIGFGIVSFGIAIGVIGYILGTKNSQTVVGNQQSANIPTLSSPSPTPVDETVNWKTFISTRCGLQVQYPNGWSTEDARLLPGTDNPTYHYGCIEINAPDHKEIITHRIVGESLDLSVSRTTKGTTYKSVTINSIEDYLDMYDKSIAPVNKVNKSYGNIKGVYYEINGYDSFGNFVFESANYIYNASWSNTYKGDYKSYIDQILSTFQFTP